MTQERVTRQRIKDQISARNTMSAKKTSAQDADAGEEAPAWAKSLFSSFQSNQESMTVKLDEICSSIRTLSKDFKAVQHRVANAEKRISTLEDDLGKEKSVAHELSTKVTLLCNRLDDLESRSRRNNIMIIGIKEGMEAGDLTGLLVRIFRYVLGAGESNPVPEVDRAHRVLRPRPNPEDPPRNIIVRLLRWEDKQKIMAAAIKKKTLFLEDRPFYIRQDLTAAVRRQRGEYNDIIQELKRQKLRCGILHPARLVVTIDGEKLIYNTPEAARTELEKRLQQIHWTSAPDVGP